jgi:hypothetical protein
VLCRQLDQPAWVGLLVGAAGLVLIVLIIGRKTSHDGEPAPVATT